MPEEKRKIVYPSQVVGDTRSSKPGRGVFVEKGQIRSERLGIVQTNKNYVNVNPLKGRYDPVPGDFVIGVVEMVSTSMWLLDVRAPAPALLHVNEVPWDVDFGDTESYLKVGDCVSARISDVDEIKKINASMKKPYDRNHRDRRGNDRDRGGDRRSSDPPFQKLNGGFLMEVDAMKVPRIIGKQGSMISLIKKETGCRVFVGKNGRIWIDGELAAIEKVVSAIKIIEREATSFGLTNRIEEFLKNNE